MYIKVVCLFTHPSIVRLSAHDEVPSQEGNMGVASRRGLRGGFPRWMGLLRFPSSEGWVLSPEIFILSSREDSSNSPLDRGDFSNSPLERGWGCVYSLLNEKRLNSLYIKLGPRQLHHKSETHLTACRHLFIYPSYLSQNRDGDRGFGFGFVHGYSNANDGAGF